MSNRDRGSSPFLLIMTMRDSLETFGLQCLRGDRLLFSGVSFELEMGEILYIEGPNGVGKTTLLRALCGFVLPEQGEILWRGVSIFEDREGFLGELLYIGHLPALKGELTPLENLQYLSALYPAARRDLETALMEVGLEEHLDVPTRQLSAGQRQRVALARLLLREATLWVLDEPFSSLDQQASHWLCEQFHHHLRRGGMIVFTSHQPLSGFGSELKRLDLTQFRGEMDSETTSRD